MTTLKRLDFYGQRDAFLRVQWVADPWAWIDPYKEEEANKARLENKTASVQMLCAEAGIPWERVIDDEAEEKAYRKEKGVEKQEPPKGGLLPMQLEKTKAKEANDGEDDGDEEATEEGVQPDDGDAANS